MTHHERYRRVSNLWCDIIVRLEDCGVSYENEVVVRVVLKLRPASLAWPRYGQITSLDGSHLKPLVEL